MFHFRRFWLEAPDYILQFLTTMLVRTKFTTPEPKLPSLTTITSSARMSSMATPAFITRCHQESPPNANGYLNRSDECDHVGF